ncbi:hypothetical protein V9L05_18115 [Bernardetia sp. Wsw4-3y2]|uniref:hypothetical protein n=1 Tax=Bernardetia sp. Wsw4-3y2 TaxID=3127471 RepID=UPI0030CF6B59
MRRSTFFTSLESDLYYALLHEANTRRWKETFSISNGWLTAKIGTSEPSLIRARNKLKQCGLIDFVSGKTKRQPSKYRLIPVDNHSNNFSSDVSANDEGLNDFSSDVSRNISTNDDYLNNFSSDISQSVSSNVSPSVRQVKSKDIRYKNKDNTNTHEDFSKNNFEEENSKNENFEKPTEEKISKPPAETEISPSKKVAPKKVSQKTQEAKVDALELPFESEEFRENWLGFRQVRKEMRKPVTPTAAKMIFKKLKPFGEKIAIKALEDSISNNWQGVFPKNDDQERSYSAPKNNLKPPKIDLRNADYTL